MSVVNPIVDVIADEIMLSIDDAAACSHRPEHVRTLFADANSRFLFARRIAARLGLPDGEAPSLDDLTLWAEAVLAYCERDDAYPTASPAYPSGGGTDD